MKKIAIISVLLTLMVVISAQNAPPNIGINIREYRDLNLSEIAGNVTMVNLSSPDEYPLLLIQNFIIASDSYFVLAKCAADERGAGYVLQFGKDGSFKRRIGLKDEKTGDFILASGLFYSSDKIYVKYNGRVGVYDKEGTYVSVFDNDVNFDYMFNDYMWFREIEPDFDNGTAKFIVSRKQVESGVKDNIIEFNVAIQGNNLQSAPIKYSFDGNNNYIISSDNNTVYSFNTKSNSIKTLLTFDVDKDKTPLMTAESFVSGSYVYYAYIYRGIQFVYLYDMAMGTGVNIRISRDQSGVIVSGIKDDLKNTGFVGLKQTNIPGRLYFTQKKASLTMLSGQNNLAETVVFVVDLK